MMMRLVTGVICLTGVAAFAFAQGDEVELRKVECERLIVYTPIEATSDEQVCSGFGGRLIGLGAPRESMTILVKNQPVGGAIGLKFAGLPLGE